MEARSQPWWPSIYPAIYLPPVSCISLLSGQCGFTFCWASRRGAGVRVCGEKWSCVHLGDHRWVMTRKIGLQALLFIFRSDLSPMVFASPGHVANKSDNLLDLEVHMKVAKMWFNRSDSMGAVHRAQRRIWRFLLGAPPHPQERSDLGHVAPCSFFTNQPGCVDSGSTTLSLQVPYITL